MFWFSASFGQLTGTYTVYGTTPDYATVQAACTDLETMGQSGPVIFDIRDGNYSEVITLNTVAGNSATNTITFQSESADSTLVNISSSIGTPFTFTDVNYVHFNHIGISYTGTGAEVIRFDNGGNGSAFNNVAIFSSSTNGTYAVQADRDAGVNDFKFNNSSINSLSGGIFLLSNNTNVNNYAMDNSTIVSVYSALQIYAEKFANGATILNCDISATNGDAFRLNGYYGSANNLTISNSTLSSDNDFAFRGYSDFTMNDGLIEYSVFNSDNNDAFYIEGYYGSVSNWMVTNSKFTSKSDAFRAYSDQTVSDITIVNDSMLVNLAGLTGGGDALNIEGYSLTQNIDIHNNYFYTDSANYGGEAIQLYAGSGSLLDVMCYNNEIKSEYGISFQADAIAGNWWIDNNTVSTKYDGLELDYEYASASDIVIIHNEIEVANGFGIDLDGEGTLSDVRIDSNTVNSYYDAIALEGYAGVNNVQTIDNQIISANGDGIYMYSGAAINDAQVIGNTIVSDDYGIYIRGYDAGLSEMNIDNNNIDANYRGIHMESNAGVTTTSVTNNTVDAYYQAIYIEGEYGGIDELEVDNNYAFSELDDGIAVYSYSTISNTNISNNEAYGDTVNCCDHAIYVDSDDANLENVKILNNEAFAYYYGIRIEAYSGNGTNCLISNNDVWAGNYGIEFDGAGSGSEISFNNIYPLYSYGTALNYGIYTDGNGGVNSGFSISNNYIENVSNTGIRARYISDLVIENNEIRAMESANNLTGISARYISGTSRINRNRILAISETEGILVGNSNGTAAHPIVVSNNFVTGFENSFNIYTNTYIDVIHNSVSTPINSQLFYISGVTDMNILNNIFKSSITAGVIYWGEISNANINIDYNVYNFDPATTNISAGTYFGTNASLLDFQTNFGADANSMNANPMFMNDTLDLHIPCGNTVLSAGIVTSVLDDVDGGARNLTTPTIGAHEIAPDVANFLADSAYFCQTADLIASAVGTYAWSTSETTQIITVTAVGTYYCTVTDGCGNTSYDSIVVWTDNPTANFAWGLNGYQGVFSNSSTGGTSYFWDFGDQTTSSDMNPIHNFGPEDASYTVILTVTNDCGGVDTYTQIVTISNLDIEDESIAARGFSVYPNPTQGNFIVDFALLEGENINMFLIDMNGRVVYSDVITNEVGAFQKYLNISEFADGTYFLKINTDSESIVKRIVKQK